ncbi:biliverdin-producing heme oxygenase [Halpernia frigidisoli]|uniref:Heme oxygenase n=1 Tax=Halpernia frigidisoli TaxID=1125876 RepID=A0A1I3IZ33_9FLAO|nr:biliverdin-producing heme oxygenase [Halpernia frigidisoli]SFI53252.1 Heme oxygenase [Halpernia frigidisoli]
MISILLKEQTRSLHDQVEERLLSKKIMDKSFDLNDYRFVLKHNYNFINHFEEAVFSKISVESAEKLHPEKRRKLPAITKDILLFDISRLFEKSKLSLKNEAEAFGILYVMEGATLGGNMIAKNLLKNIHFDGVNFNYFGLYGDQTGFLWKLFIENLEEKSQFFDDQDFLNGAEMAYQFLLNH